MSGVEGCGRARGLRARNQNSRAGKGVQGIAFPKGLCTNIVDTWVLKGLLHPCLEVYVCSIYMLGPLGIVGLRIEAPSLAASWNHVLRL